MRFIFEPLFYSCWTQSSTSWKFTLAANGNTNRDTLTHVGGTLRSATSLYTCHNNTCIATRIWAATLPKELTIAVKTCARKVIQPGNCDAHAHTSNYEFEAMVRATSMIALAQPVKLKSRHLKVKNKTMKSKNIWTIKQHSPSKRTKAYLTLHHYFEHVSTACPQHKPANDHYLKSESIGSTANCKSATRHITRHKMQQAFQPKLATFANTWTTAARHLSWPTIWQNQRILSRTWFHEFRIEKLFMNSFTQK